MDFNRGGVARVNECFDIHLKFQKEYELKNKEVNNNDMNKI